MASKKQAQTKTSKANQQQKSILLLSDYFKESGRALDVEQNRFVFLLVGAAILGTAVIFPIGAAFLNETYRWVMVIPGSLILLIAIGTAFFRNSKDTTQCFSMIAPLVRPCNQILACWGVRSAAEDDIKASILASRHALFIAGACLTTLKKTLSDKDIINHVSSMRAQNSNYKITALVVGKGEDCLLSEKGRKSLPDNLKTGRRVLERFVQDIMNQLPHAVNSHGVEIKAYDSEVLPRHFILKADSNIYVGSYLCHEEGSYSYLLRLKEQREGRSLYSLFLTEVDYLMAHSQPINVEN